MPIKLAADHLEQIRQRGESAYPYECCGLLLGKVDKGQKHVTETYAAANAKEEGTQHNRFLIPPAAVKNAETYARHNNLEILGFYHSHPNAPARPSQFDLEHAWPFYSYVIVSVQNGKSEDLTCWKMLDDRSRFEPESMLT